MSRFRYIFFGVVLAAMLLAEYNQVAFAEAVNIEIEVEDIAVVESKPLSLSLSLSDIIAIFISPSETEAETDNDITKILAPHPLFAVLSPVQYNDVPIEDLNPIEWVDPWQTKERITTSWLPIIESVLESGDYPNVTAILMLGIIAQETGGDASVVGCDFNGLGAACGVGVMAIAPQPWTGTISQLMNPTYNIGVGISMFNTIYDQALEHGFRPGRDATRAALGAYNCSWKSLLADRCYSFGGFTYADKVLNYWLPLLEIYLEEQE